MNALDTFSNEYDLNNTIMHRQWTHTDRITLTENVDEFINLVGDIFLALKNHQFISKS